MNFYKTFRIILLKNKFLFLLFSWIAVQSLFIWRYGIVTGLEASKYIDEANHFLQIGNFSTNNHYLYSTQILLIAAVIKLHLSYTVIVIIQIILNLAATLMFFKLATSFFNNPFIPVIATFFLL